MEELQIKIRSLYAVIGNVPEILIIALNQNDDLIGRVTLSNHVTRSASISMLYVDEPFRRRGVGAKLIGQSCQFAKDVNISETVGLVVTRHNLAAQNLYKKLGFQFALAYDDGDYLMIKTLKETTNET